MRGGATDRDSTMRREVAHLTQPRRVDVQGERAVLRRVLDAVAREVVVSVLDLACSGGVGTR